MANITLNFDFDRIHSISRLFEYLFSRFLMENSTEKYYFSEKSFVDDGFFVTTDHVH